MLIIMSIIFILGYVAIALEHPLKINKAAPALLLGVSTWAVYAFGSGDAHLIDEKLLEHFGEIASILFFLIGAMTIVEIIDSHNGFAIITDTIKTTNKAKLLWIISFLTFFLSAALDNLTTSIVMISLLRKLIKDKNDRMFFAGIVVIAANAGGAWSPIGDVTTTMLWIGKKVTTVNIMVRLIIPSLISLIIPLLILSFKFKGNIKRPELANNASKHISTRERNLVFFTGIGGLLFVPVFKTVTHLEPFMGMLFSLAIVWIVTELIHKRKETMAKEMFSPLTIIRKIDTPSVLFFLGILVGVASLQSAGILTDVALWLDKSIGNQNLITISIGLLSSIVDNVPLVAAGMGMYDFPTDHVFWEFLAYCAGTGGSALIIGSAAGVAVMGLEKINFIWYLKKMTWLALIGYFSGAAAYILIEQFL